MTELQEVIWGKLFKKAGMGMAEGAIAYSLAACVGGPGWLMVPLFLGMVAGVAYFLKRCVVGFGWL